jgi:hypothetical protein
MLFGVIELTVGVAAADTVTDMLLEQTVLPLDVHTRR